MNPIDEAGYYFNMLGLKEEQLFVADNERVKGGRGDRTNDISSNLPSEFNTDIIKLHEEINVSAKVIANRITLLALPEDLQDLLARSKKRGDLLIDFCFMRCLFLF